MTEWPHVHHADGVAGKLTRRTETINPILNLLGTVATRGGMAGDCTTTQLVGLGWWLCSADSQGQGPVKGSASAGHTNYVE